MRRILLITNPAAARTSKRRTDRVVSALRDEQCKVELVETLGHGDAERVARESVGKEFDAIAVYGGDGTVMQVVAGIVGRDIPIGLIPGGTGNVLAGNLRLPRNTVEAARVVARGRVRKIDIGCMEQRGVKLYFVVAGGAGFDADLMARTSGEAKRRWGVGAYLARSISMLHTLRPTPYTVTIDGTTIELEATLLLIANCREVIPPILKLPVGVVLDDGLLDVIAFRVGSPWQALKVVWKLLRHKVDQEMVSHMRGSEIKVETSPARPAQLDGDVAGETPFSISVIPSGLSVLVQAKPR